MTVESIICWSSIYTDVNQNTLTADKHEEIYAILSI